MPQLQINQGPQDALLYDNSRSYFTNVGYVRTSNFQMELRDVDSQNQAKLGSTVQFVIPKAADLLGPVDLMLTTTAPDAGAGAAGTHSSWVKKFGFACIEQITFSVGSHDIEKISGEQLDIINELMRDDESRYTSIIGNTTEAYPTASGSLMLTNGTGAGAYGAACSFIVPLGLFFTKHPSQYFPLAAIAGCNDVRISIRFRQKTDLIRATSGITVSNINADLDSSLCKLRCHYIHVTGPEATTLMNKEHVRLLKLFHHDSKDVPASVSTQKVSMDLSFLHPVSELIIVLRQNDKLTGNADVRDFFTYETNMTHFSLTLNGQERHPSLSSGIDKRYIQDRLMPMLHSNTSVNHPTPVSADVNLTGVTITTDVSGTGAGTNVNAVIGGNATVSVNNSLSELLDRKEIIVYPFSLNPEGSNPAGAVNFSKVSHARLTVDVSPTTGAHTMDVYAVYYNWLQIKDGRALTSFA